MALTHVVIRDKEHGLKRITPEEAVLLYPNGRSSAYDEFMCEVCFQSPSFVAGGKQSPHFRHVGGSDDCDEKLSVERQQYSETNPLGFSLPIIIQLRNDSLHIFVGFPPISDCEMENAIASNASVKVVPRAGNDEPVQAYSYDICRERFSTEYTTFLEIGARISKQYELLFSSTDNSFSIEKHFWPRVIEGFSATGTLFSCDTGKKLPSKSSVVVARDYFLFTKTRIAHPYTDVFVTPLQSIGSWNIYRVCATALSNTAIDFFRGLGVLLTDAPSVITQLWPVAIQSSHVVSFNQRYVYFHSSDGFVSVYPHASHVQMLTDRFFSVFSPARQMMTISRYKDGVSVLRYVLLIDLASQHNTIASDVAFLIYDTDGNILQEGVHYELPKQKSITIHPQYDGFFESRRNGCIIDRKKINAGQSITLTVSIGSGYHFFQGLDEVSNIAFFREDTDERESDRACLKCLQSFSGKPIPVPSHTILTIASRLHGMPLTRLWLRCQLHNGTIDQMALKWLTKSKAGA